MVQENCIVIFKCLPIVIKCQVFLMCIWDNGRVEMSTQLHKVGICIFLLDQDSLGLVLKWLQQQKCWSFVKERKKIPKYFIQTKPCYVPKNKSALRFEGVSCRKVHTRSSMAECLVFLFLGRAVPALGRAPGLPSGAEESGTF